MPFVELNIILHVVKRETNDVTWIRFTYEQHLLSRTYFDLESSLSLTQTF